MYVCIIAALLGRLLSVVYIACKVERFVSIILNEAYYIIIIIVVVVVVVVVVTC